MKGFLSKVLFFFLLFIAFIVFPSSIQAAATDSTNSAQAESVNSNVPNNLHNFTQRAMIETMSALTCQLIGIDPVNPNQSCLGPDSKTGKIGFLPAADLKKGQLGGAIGGMSGMISMLYKQPVHTSDYFVNLAQNFGISKKANAQGVGFQGLTPLIRTWTAFRNVVYLLLVIVFVIIGLAIMLRIKIDPRTVMTIQNQIPKIIVGILAVTFSFAIAGFLVDMMWVFSYLIFHIVSGISTEVANFNPTVLQGQNPITALDGPGGYNIIGMASDAAWKGSGIIQRILGIAPTAQNMIPFASFPSIMFPTLVPGSQGILDQLINIVSTFAGVFTIVKTLSWAPLIIVGESAGALQHLIYGIPLGMLVYTGTEALLRIGIPYLLIFVVITCALFVALFRLWFALLMAYVQILLDVVLAPFWIIGGMIPGSPINIGGWLRDLAANLLAFPATIFMLMMGKVFMDAFTHAAHPFAPPLIGDFGDPTMFGPIIGIGIILITPNIVNLTKQILKAPKSNLMGGVMGGVAAGAAVPKAGIKTAVTAFARTPQLGERGGIKSILRAGGILG